MTSTMASRQHSGFILQLSPVVILACILMSSLLQVTSGGTSSDLYHDGLFTSGSVYCEKRSCTLKNGVLDFDHATSVGTMNDTLLVTGWGILDIKAQHTPNSNLSDADIMFAAGFLEGALTAKHIEIMYENTIGWYFPDPHDPMKKKAEDWFYKNRQWADMMCTQHPEDPLWRHTSYILAQLDGLYAGYKSVRKDDKNALEMSAMYFLNGAGDLLDLKSVLDPSSIPDWKKFTPKQAERYFYDNTHCSALVKVLPGYENLFMSHSSWFTYRATDRIYKHYFFDVKDPATAAKKLSFSSYGGYLESLDDFYQMSSGLVMLQTTNNVFNSSLYKLVHPQSLQAWVRVRVANMMATSGRQWTQTIAQYNSGTYNNQYMVVDLKLIKLNQSLPDNTLWVAEQIPGLVVAEDVTAILRTGYWPSYNVPFFEEIYARSGYPDYVKKHGLKYSYQLAPRAEIFRRDASKVVDMQTMKGIMRYNNFTHDPYSGDSPMGAICSRGDLETGSDARPDGCYDTKVADLKMAQSFQADIISGPTQSSGLQPFSWTGPFASLPHQGLPHTYQFPFISTKPRFW